MDNRQDEDPVSFAHPVDQAMLLDDDLSQGKGGKLRNLSAAQGERGQTLGGGQNGTSHSLRPLG